MKGVSSMDFSMEKYECFCRTLKESGYNSLNLAEFYQGIQSFNLDSKVIILRHDIDRKIENALAMAEIEHRYGLKASYYFRVPHTLDKDVIRKIFNFGHEVSLHYECVDKAKGDFVKAKAIMQDELKLFQEFAPPLTVSMHGNPATKFDNRHLWQHYSLDEFGLIGEVYLTMDFEKVLYYSDTGRTWEDGKYNIKDVIPKNMKYVKNKPVLKTTDDLIKLVKIEKRNLYVLVHPERWSRNLMEWVKAYCKDFVFNMGKVCFKLLYKILK